MTRDHIAILVPTHAELAALLVAPGAFRGFPVCAEALPPAPMLRRALAPEAGPWLAPRLFLLEAARQIVGSGAFTSAPHDRRVEIGYGIAPPWRRRGLASQAVRLLVAEALASGAVDEVYAHVSPANAASQRLLARLGFSTQEQTTTAEGLMERWALPTRAGVRFGERGDT